ncbi:unnamed protein product [Brassica oleracea var. botrytis]|uniref:(rape) hypothetical protein n=1 Tax=Brassica napus TaxID=3708 RepID=A0A816J9L2_BRANA|nr:unnamed protein product [Brassica napus]
MTAKLKQVMLLWLEGFLEACSLHRVVILCHKSRKLLLRTGQCFLLNGLIFLGSLGVFKWFVNPALQWILPDPCAPVTFQDFCSYNGSYAFLRGGLLQLFYVFWFYPMYMLSFILSNIWYNDVAKYGFEAIEKSELRSAETFSQCDVPASVNMTNAERPSGFGGVMIDIGEQVYSILLLTFFFTEVYVVGVIPYIGKILNFLLLSWMYAYYCYEYKWNFLEIPLVKRLEFFESNWAFFAGFGEFFSLIYSVGDVSEIEKLKAGFYLFFFFFCFRKPRRVSHFLSLSSCQRSAYGHTVSIGNFLRH